MRGAFTFLRGISARDPKPHDPFGRNICSRFTEIKTQVMVKDILSDRLPDWEA
jgi:hypothetical protein